MPLGAHREGLRVARLLAKKIEGAGLSVRRVEEMVGWGQKTLQQILNGEQPIRVSHVAAVLETLGLDLREFYRELASPKGAEAARESQAIAKVEPSRKTTKDRRTEEAPLEGSRDYRMVGALLEKCRSLRYSDPEGMVLAASLAVTLTERMGASQEEPEKLVDHQAQAWAELGNAYRVSNDLPSAETALAHALDLSDGGTGDPWLLAHIMDLTASLFSDQRRFAEAYRLLDWVYIIYWHAGDKHLAARALISKGISVGLAFKSEEAVNLLTQGLPLLDAAQDPKLLLAAIHALLWFLTDWGKVESAAGLLSRSRDLYATFDEPLLKLRARWLQGRIDAGLGDETSAEQAFLQVRKGFQEAGLPVTAAAATLDLAAVWLRQGRTAEIGRLVDEMVAIFRAQKIQREPVAALLMLRKALQKDKVTAALLRAVAAEVQRAERLPKPKTG